MIHSVFIIFVAIECITIIDREDMFFIVFCCKDWRNKRELEFISGWWERISSVCHIMERGKEGRRRKKIGKKKEEGEDRDK